MLIFFTGFSTLVEKLDLVDELMKIIFRHRPIREKRGGQIDHQSPWSVMKT